MEEPFIDNLVHQGINNAAKTGMISPQASTLPPEQMDKVKTAVKVLRARHGEERPAQIRKEMIKDFPFVARFYITTENFDKVQMLQSLQDAINVVSQNPAIGLDPTKLIEEKLDIILPNIAIASLRKTPEQLQADRAAAMQAMGAVNKANPQKAPLPEAPAKAYGQANQTQA